MQHPTLLASCLPLLTALASPVLAQNAPNVVWQEPTPGLLANSVMAAAWSPVDDALAVGSNDRWFRVRRASDGALLYSVLEPQHSNGPGTILYATDGGLIGVRNQNTGLSFRVQQASDGTFLGNIVATVNANGIITFAPDAALLASTGGDGTLSRWRFSDLTCFRVTGSGYQKTTTTFDFSPDGALQSAAAKGRMVVQRRSDGTVLRAMRGGARVEFSPDSHWLAAWSGQPANDIALWDTTTWTVARHMQSDNAQEGVSALRFTPDGARLVSSGYSPYLDAQGLWQQRGFIRFWDVASGAMLWNFDQQTDIAVTSPVAFSPDGLRFVYGMYAGGVAVAVTPP